jgi:hypothetical protein
MITTFMAAFAFGYCVADIVINYFNQKRDYELLKSTVEQELNR